MPGTALLRTLAFAALLAACSAVGADEAERIVDVLALSEGMSAADVGAGDGERRDEIRLAQRPDPGRFGTVGEVGNRINLGVGQHRFK